MCLNLIRCLPKPISTREIERNVGHIEATYEEVHTYMKGHAQERTAILTTGQQHLCRVIRFSIDQSIATTGSVYSNNRHKSQGFRIYG